MHRVKLLYSQASTQLACCSNEKLKQILADAKPMHEGIGGKSALIYIDKTPIKVAESNLIGDIMTTIIETDRLILRTWRKDDADPYFQINQDPKVIELLGGPLTMEQVNDFIPAVNKHQEMHGYTLWAVELKETGQLMGFIGLNYIDWTSHFTPAVEVGWRLGSQYWNKGYATEGAKASLEYGFRKCSLKEIVSFTVPANTRSIRVMEKIGLKRDVSGDFAHPKLATDHPLSQHILYRLTVDEYLHGK